MTTHKTQMPLYVRKHSHVEFHSQYLKPHNHHFDSRLFDKNIENFNEFELLRFSRSSSLLTSKHVGKFLGGEGISE
ncbi:CLUMA_CG015527, isoform A [Clunio marinus]|uniref:CLUMA_CG015527, isoform A n=1 Tax=Clunio marinus TaxID=568069 RepID=A0A1J1IPK4_9DIPT|nr:CLUMA_CG015527, isoform A [Clunio marinus]